MAEDSKDPLIGTRIREYEILDVIGKGGMGAVYRARHVYLEEDRAIKVIHAPLADGNSSFVDRFIREAKILTKLRHPDLVELYEFGRLDENMFFMVMELMKGESVRQKMKRLGRIPFDEALRIIREAANGLHVAHQRGIVHRDISPDNLMLVNADGTEITKVIDFGIAKPLYRETQKYTIAEMFIGKPEFSSPEQCGAHEEGEEIDGRSDIYSLAVTLYYIVSDKLPFHATSPQGYLIKHASEPPKPLSAHFKEGELPEGLEKLIMKALSKRREQRHASMAEFAEEIERVQNRALSNQGQTAVASGELRPGMVFAKRYEVEQKLGRGGMGVVYRATDKFLDIPVALKTINPGIADDARVLSRLKREVVLARKISHPNVCRIYDIGESEGIHYVSMELLEGQPLAEILMKQGAIPIQESMRITKQILDAMEAAHSVGVFHRDLKPQNIHVNPTGRASIMDFGISTSADVSRLTQSGALVGTPRYMAPEQFRGDKPDLRADIYSMGIILFEMLTGALPYEANTPASVMYAHLHHPPRKPSELISDLPRGLEQAVLKALEKDPENRFQSVGEFREALEPYTKTGGQSMRVPVSENVASTLNLQQMTQQNIQSTQPAVPPPIPYSESVTDASIAKKKFQGSRIGKIVSATALGAALIVTLLWLMFRSNDPNVVVQKMGQKKAATTPQQEKIPSEDTAKPAAQPAAPEADAVETPANDSSTTESVVPVQPAPSQPAPLTTEPTKVQPLPASDLAGRGPQYSVEVMATSWKPRAEERVSFFNQKGYEAFLGEKKDDKGTSYRVRVGRFNDYSKAKELANRLKSELQVTGWVATLPKNETSTAPAPPAPEAPVQALKGDGTIVWKAAFPVKIYDGQNLIMDTAVHKSQKLKPGNYTLILNTKEGAFIERLEQKIEIKAGETTVLSVPVGYFSFRSEPPGCRITIDESYQVAAPVQDLPLLPGKHRIFLEWRDLEVEEEVTITIRENEKTRLRGTVTNDSVGVVEE